MTSIIIVNNNMKIGGVQKSLLNLLWSISDKYDVTLYLFSKKGDYIDQLPPRVKVETCSSLFRYLGVSQDDCRNNLRDKLERGFLAGICKIFGRPFVLKMMLLSQKKLSGTYDVAVSYLQNGNIHSFYGGVNEFVLGKIDAKRKIAFLHCDYSNCGANHPDNNRSYALFDSIAACSDGCKDSFLKSIPELEDKCTTVRNFQRHQLVQELSLDHPVIYDRKCLNAVIVGRLAHEKAVDRAIKGIAYVRNQGINVKLHVIGEGNMRTKLKELTSSLNIENAIIFHGEQSNPYRFMLNADLLLITSYHEAAPIVVDEAYILSLPVLSVATTSTKEMIVDRECGWVCENTQEGINNELMNVLSDTTLLENMKKLLKQKNFSNAEAFKQFQSLIQ